MERRVSRFGELEVGEAHDASLKECLKEAVQGRGQGWGEEGEVEQRGESDPSTPSPPTSTRRISKDMIGLPTNFRHVLHIDPSSADPSQLSLLLRASTDQQQDLECEADHEQDQPAWCPPDTRSDTTQAPRDAPTEAVRAARPHRPSSRVRKSMISLPTNFQHVNHISAGERLHAPASPPPDVPPEPRPHDHATPSHTPTWDHHATTTTTTHHPRPPPLTLAPTHAWHPPGPLSAPPHIDAGSLHENQHVRFGSGDTGFDFDFAQYRIPTPPDPNESDAIRSSSFPRQLRTYHEQVTEEEARREEEQEEEEEEQEEEEGAWRSDERGFIWWDRCQGEARRPPPLDTPPPLPLLPPAPARVSIGKPTNFQHLRHLDAVAADRLLHEASMAEKAAKEGEKRRGRERGREREREREQRTPSLPPSLPHRPPPQDPPPAGKLRKAMIGQPTNFQHVTHVGFGGVEGGQ